MKRGIGAVVAVAAVCAAGWASAAPLEAELSGLVADNPQIKSNQAQLAAAGQGVRASFAPLLPSLDVSGGYGYESISLPAYRATPDGPFEAGANSWSVTLKENVYDGGRALANRAGAKLTRDATAFGLTSVRQNVLLAGTTAYINVLKQRELVDLSGQNEGNIRKQLNLEDERVRRGSGIAVDVLQAKSRLQISLERLVANRGAYQDAQSRYMQVFGHLPDPANMTLPPPPESQLPKSVDEAVDVALRENPTIIANAKRIDITAAQKRSVEAEYQPSVDIVLQAKYEHDFNGAPGVRRDQTAKLQVTWNLFNGLGTSARAAQSAYDYEARSQDLLDVKRKTEEQTRMAWQALQTTRERLALLENAVNIASEVFESRKKLRESGKETVINVLDAENEVYSARINYTSAMHDARTAAYQLLFAIGRLELETAASGG